MQLDIRSNNIAFLLVASAFLLARCAELPTSATTGSEKLYIVTTTGMIEDAVKNIAGDLVKTEALMGPGVDPHLYKATHGDLSRLNQADAIFYNGLHLEGKMGEVLHKLAHRKPVTAVAEAIPQARLLKAVGSIDAYDPHVWFDVQLWTIVVEEINYQLQRLDTANAPTYQQNTKTYINKLNQLHLFVSQSIATIPPSQRVLITAHDAFEYFGRAYNIEVRGLQGISTVSDFGLKDIVAIVDFISKKKIKAVFVESSVPKRAIEAVVTGCEEQGHGVKIGGTLFSDAMGDDQTFEGTYLGMVTTNVNTIVNALR